MRDELDEIKELLAGPKFFRSKAVDLNDKIANGISSYLTKLRESVLDSMSSCCSSPIERLFIVGLLNSGWAFDNHFSRSDWEKFLDLPCMSGAIHPVSEFCLKKSSDELIIPQLALCIDEQKFIVDFAVYFFGTVLAIELDGHDFHERTKEQARKEKSRQRQLTAAGWTVVRFTGSEIYSDVIGCVSEITGIHAGLLRVRRES